MKTIQASEAKTKFLSLLDDVERGDSVLITRHGRPVARLVPDKEFRKGEARRAIEEVREMRKTAPRVTVEEILAWRDEGRK
jgi:prevent-host-death family protein